MSVGRRDFLKGLLACSTLAVMRQPAWAGVGMMPPAVRPDALPLLLRTGTLVDQEFFGAVQAVLGSVGVVAAESLHLARSDLARPQDLQRALQGARGRCVVGVIEGAHAPLLFELLRSAGVAVPCAGEHSDAGPIADGASRHRLLTTPASHGIAALLQWGVPAAQVEEHALGVATVPVPPTVPRDQPTGHWAAVTGHLLARVAIGTWKPSPPLARRPGLQPTDAQPNRHYASFVLRLAA